MARRLVISSRSNSWFQQTRLLLKRKGIEAARQCLVPGTKIIEELLQEFSDDVLEQCTLIYPQGTDGPTHPLVRETYLEPALFTELDVTMTKQTLLLAPLPPQTHLEPNRDTIYLPAQDPQNVGSVFRAIECLYPAQVVLLPTAAHPFLPQSLRASHGSVFRIPFQFHQGESKLPEVDALDLNGIPIQKWAQSKKSPVRLLLGLEGEGIAGVESYFSAINPVTIPMQKGESLNVAQAAAIAFFALTNR